MIWSSAIQQDIKILQICHSNSDINNEMKVWYCAAHFSQIFVPKLCSLSLW